MLQVLIRRRRISQPGTKNLNALKNVCKFKSCLICTDTKDHLWYKVHIHNLFKAQIIQISVLCVPLSQQCLLKLLRTQCLNPGFPVEGNLPYSLHHLLHNMPRFTRQVGVPLPCTTGWTRLLSPDGLGRRVQRQDSPGARTPPPSTSFYILCIYLRHSFPQRPPMSEQVLCSVSCSRTLQWRRKMWPGFQTFSLSIRPLTRHTVSHTLHLATTFNFIKHKLIHRLLLHIHLHSYTMRQNVSRM